ncbi:NAD(P)H-binding protein [Halothermothrix orenii]|uniref:Shikimate/quinate 5-dehydrogenase n=1 Tax=Halothermothrix orenii (strain H 168 / OCM 544 / DSM 9562) TaxID=373903 RepID=B8D080_HALOH|nr:NAD(P)H-binding protein [Halothermothrix orenii]ACL68834.1 Shikimate/quinate 5-dehydrogenase [Halothermothrix orenii H 168]
MNKFAFIIHPLELDDVARKFSWASKVPDYIVEKFVRTLPAIKASHITGIRSKTGKEVEGYFVVCPLTSEQMLKLPADKVIKKIIKAGKKAEKLGAQIIGLGAFTSVVGDKGITVAKALDVPVTTGNSYTVATAIEGTKLAARKMGHDIKKARVTVVGATGSIGRAVSLILGEDIKHLSLVARDEKKLSALQEEVLEVNPELDVSYSTDVSEAVRESQIVISASGAVKALIDADDLQPGTVVCDVARPRDVAERVGRERDDVLVIEGGIVEVPGPVNFNFNFGYPPKTSYACMAETMILTLEERFENYSLGPVLELKKVKESLKLAKKHGFKLAGLRSFERPLSEKQIALIRENAEEKMSAVF